MSLPEEPLTAASAGQGYIVTLIRNNQCLWMSLRQRDERRGREAAEAESPAPPRSGRSWLTAYRRIGRRGGGCRPPPRSTHAVAVVDTSGLLPVVEHNLNGSTGRPRQFTAKALLVGMTLHSIRGAKSMVITDITETMQGPHSIPAAQTRPRMRDHLRHAVACLRQDRWTPRTRRPINLDSGTRLSVEQFADRLLASSTPDDYHLSPAIALDGTDLETWARRRSWASKKSPVQGRHRDPGRHRRQSRQADERTRLAPRRRGRTPAELARLTGPRRIPVRPQRSRRRRLRGFELNLATQVPDVGGQPVPHLITGLTLTPAGSHRGHAAVRTIDGLTSTGYAITDLCADRGYSFCLADTFVLPMWARNIEVSSDPHPAQRGPRPGPSPAPSGSTGRCSAKRSRNPGVTSPHQGSSPPSTKPKSRKRRATVAAPLPLPR